VRTAGKAAQVGRRQRGAGVRTASNEALTSRARGRARAHTGAVVRPCIAVTPRRPGPRSHVGRFSR